MLRNELPGLHMTVSAERLGLVMFECKVIKKNRSLVEDIEILQKTFAEKKAFWEGIEEKLSQLRSSVVEP